MHGTDVGAFIMASRMAVVEAGVVVPAAAGIGPFATWSPVKRETARVVLVVLLAGAAVWIAFAARPGSYGY